MIKYLNCSYSKTSVNSLVTGYFLTMLTFYQTIKTNKDHNGCVVYTWRNKFNFKREHIFQIIPQILIEKALSRVKASSVWM